ncbi:pneumococcal serine-rich repeat protein-like [Littorina saxatilis]|uniref:pneumococcal serine-rich repeat protein-like n=1 Tax=Littorina saxatilis TaxID=31220 RepID=UPI0038B45D77
MDLASVLAELKVVDDFRQPDKNLATASFCQRACKVLEKVVKQAPDIEFNHLVIGIWIVVGSFNELLPHLVDGTSLTDFLEKLFRECARVVLDIKWQQLDEEEKCRQNFTSSLSSCHQLMAPRGFTRFGVLQELMDNPWTDPVLTMVMGSEEDNEEGEGLAYIQAQDPEILKLRVELMQQENCDEFALNLCTWCLKHPRLAGNLGVRKTQFFLLNRLTYSEKLQEECQSMGPEDSIQLIKSMQGGEENKELCTLLAQTFLVQNWIKPADNDSKKELLRLWIKLQYQADCDRDRDFISSLWAVAKLSQSTEQLLFVIDGVREQCGDAFLQFCTDLCVFAINVDKGFFEKLKGTSASGPNEEILAHKRDMAQVCNKLALIVSHAAPKVSFCCALTAFAMMPSEQSLQAVREAYQRKNQAGVSSKSQCCSNCASDQGQCLKNDDDDKASKEVNIATLYEVERLCGMLRPAYLSPESDFSILFTMCKQYMMKENGEAVKSALVRRKSAPAVQVPVTVASAPGTSHAGQSARPNILRPSAPHSSTLVDGSSQASNLGVSGGVAYSAVNFHGSMLTPGAPGGLVGQPLVAPSNSQDKPAGTSGQQQASGQNTAQRLVLQQLSSDMVQALLHLIHSGQISPVTLNQIMSKHPNMSLQALQNLVSQARAHKAATTTQGQQHQAQQVTQEQQGQGQQQRLQPQSVEILQQQLQLQRLQGQQTQQLLVQQRPSHPSYNTAQVLQPTGVQTQQAGLRQSAPQQVQSPNPTAAQPRMQGGQLVVQQSLGIQPQPIRPRPPKPSQQQLRTVAQSQQQILQGVQQAQSVHLSGTGQIQVTQPLHVMTFRQSAPVQTTASRVQGTQVLIQTSNQMLSHLSGGNVTSLQQQPQLVRLPATAVTMSSQAIARSDPHAGAHMTMIKASRPETAKQGASVGSMSQAHSSSNGGNRNYSINNLLFTGEQQNTLSISLPDQLPVISVDTISDTLRALSDNGGSSLTVAKDPVQQAHIPVTHTVSLVGSQSAQLTMNALHVAQRQQVQGVSTQQLQKSSKMTTPKTSHSMQVITASSHKHPQAPVSVATQPKPTQNSQAYGQPLPAISSLFGAGSQVLPQVSTAPANTPPPSTSIPAPTSPTRKGGAGQGKGQKKTGCVDKTAAKAKEKADKGDLMRLLKQVMTINVDEWKERKKREEGSGSESTYLAIPGQPVGTGPKSKSAVTTLQNQLLPADRPLFQQSSQPGLMSVSAAVPPQPASVAQFSKNLSTSVQASSPASSVVSRVPSLASSAAAPNTSGPIPSTSGKAYSESFPPFSYSSPKLHNILSGKSTQDIALASASSSPLSASGADGSGASSPLGQFGVPAVCYSPSTILSGYMNSAAAGLSGGMEMMRTYSRQDSGGQSRSPRRDQRLGTVMSIPIPASILPEGGIMDMGRDGDQSIATYRCIICAKAFMTLDALRLHVKQICKPGFNQPPNLSSRMAYNKAQATEAGLETSTVFQCMRCFELCISEQGIRDHKQVCSKAPKPKSKSKSKAKPKPPKSEEEQATEAKVMELLNKCLGENREKLIEEQNALAAKQANAKKRQLKKRPSTDGDSVASSSSEAGLKSKKVKDTDGESVASSSSETAPKSKKVKKDTDGESVASSSSETAPKPKKVKKDKEGYAAGSPVSVAYSPVTEQINNTVSAFGSVRAETLQPEVQASVPTTAIQASVPTTAIKAESTAVETSISPPVTATPPAVPAVQSENTGTNSGDNKGDVKPKPKRKYYPKKKKPVEGAGAEKAVQSEASKPKGQFDTAAKAKKTESSEAKPAKEKKAKKEPGPPPPRYKELSGSGGRSFFKCMNCGQTLCSIENFSDHWGECIVKKPPPIKPKRPPKEKKPKTESSSSVKSSGIIYSTIESMESVINSVASGSYEIDASESGDTRPDSNIADIDPIASSDVIVDVESVPECEESSQASTLSSDTEPKAPDSEENSQGADCMSEVTAGAEAPVVFEADTTEVINELQVETTVEDGSSSSAAPQVKQSLVVLEKLNLRKKGKKKASCKVSKSSGEVDSGKTDKEVSQQCPAEGISKGTVKKYEEASEQSPAEESSRGTVKKSISRKAGQGLRKTGNKHGRKPGAKTVPAARRREREAKEGGSSSKAATKATVKPQSGDSKYCGLCRRYFDRRIILIQHIASKHVQPYTVKKLGDTSSYFCHLCQRVFPQFSGYMSHVSSHSQAIMKKFSELQSLNEIGFPGRSRRIAHQKGTVGRNLNKHGRTSPRALSKADKREERSAARRPRRLKSPGTTSPAAKKGKDAPLPSGDRRSSVRAAQKQALSKIYISSLGINSSAEPLKESNKRKLSSEEKAEARPKRTRAGKSKNEEAKTEEDEENTEESGEETTDQEDVSPSTEVTSSGAAATSAVSKDTKVAEKASMDANAAQSFPGPGKCPLSVECPQRGPSPVNAPQLPSPLSAVPKKPSFLDSFLSFVSSRSPEAPLPINQSKRRISNMGNLEKDTPAAALTSRRGSCDTPFRSLLSAQPQLATTSHLSEAMKPLQRSVSNTESPMTSRAKSPQGSKVVNVAARRKSSDYDNVFYYGRFEEQLTQPCKVVLGDRINPEPPEEAVINVKQCSVNLGPKVSPEALGIMASMRRATADTEKNSESDTAQPVETKVTSDSSPSVADTRAAAEGEGVSLLASDAASLDQKQTLGQSTAVSQTKLNAAGELCVEATLSVLSLPEGSAGTDVVAVISSMALQAAQQNPLATAETAASTGTSLPAVAVPMLSVTTSGAEPQLPSLTQFNGEGAQQSVNERQSDDVMRTDAPTSDPSALTPVKGLQHADKDNRPQSAREADQTVGNDEKDNSAEKTKTESSAVFDNINNELEIHVADTVAKTVGESKVNLRAENSLLDHGGKTDHADQSLCGQRDFQTVAVSSSHPASSSDFDRVTVNIEELINDSIERVLNEFPVGCAKRPSHLHPSGHTETAEITAQDNQSVNVECIAETTPVGEEKAQTNLDAATLALCPEEQVTLESASTVAESQQASETTDSDTLQEAAACVANSGYIESVPNPAEQSGSEEVIPVGCDLADQQEVLVREDKTEDDPALIQEHSLQPITGEGTMENTDPPQEAGHVEDSQSSVNRGVVSSSDEGLQGDSACRSFNMSCEEPDTSNDIEKRHRPIVDPTISSEVPSVELPAENKAERGEVEIEYEHSIPHRPLAEEHSVPVVASSTTDGEGRTQGHQQLSAHPVSVKSQEESLGLGLYFDSTAGELVKMSGKEHILEEECQIHPESVELEDKISSQFESVSPSKMTAPDGQERVEPPLSVDKTAKDKDTALDAVSSSSVQLTRSARQHNADSMSMMDFLMKSAFVIPETHGSGSENHKAPPCDDHRKSGEVNPNALDHHTAALSSVAATLQGETSVNIEVENHAGLSLHADGQTDESEVSDGADFEFDDGDDVEDDEWDTSDDRVQILTLPDERHTAVNRTPSTEAAEGSHEPESVPEPVVEEKLISDEVLSAGSVVSEEGYNSDAVVSLERDAEQSVHKSLENNQTVPTNVDQSLQIHTCDTDQKMGHVPAVLPTGCVDEDAIANESAKQQSKAEHPESWNESPGDLENLAECVPLDVHESGAKGCDSAQETLEDSLSGEAVAAQMQDSAASPVEKSSDSNPRLEEQQSISSTAQKDVPDKSDEADPESDLPELCIVPDTNTIVVRIYFDRKPEKERVTPPSADDESTVISAVPEDQEVKIRNVRGKPKSKKKPETFIAKVVETTKEVVVQQEEEAAPVESPTRKPLLGVKPLRSVLKPQPFVWEADGEEDRNKLARIERSRKALRQKAQVAPFCWDSDEADDGEKGRSKGEGIQKKDATSQGSKHSKSPLQPVGDKVEAAPSPCDTNLSNVASNNQNMANETEPSKQDGGSSHNDLESARKTPSATLKNEPDVGKKLSDTMKKPSDTPKKQSGVGKKESDTVKKMSDTGKKESDTVKKMSDAEKKESDTVKKMSDTGKKESDTVKKMSDTGKKESDTVKKMSDTGKKESDTVKKASDTVKKASDTVKKASDTVKKAPDTVKKASDTVKKASDTVKKASDTAKVEQGKSIPSKSVSEKTVDDKNTANNKSAAHNTTSKSKETVEASRKKKVVAPSSAPANEKGAAPKVENASAERSRMTYRSKNARRPGSFDKSGETASTAAEKRAPFRKSRSCDIGGDELVSKDSPAPQRPAEEQKSVIPDIKIESDSCGKTSAEMGQSNEQASSQETAPSSINSQLKVLTRSSEKVAPSPSLHKWRSRRSLPSSTVRKAEASEVKTETNTSSKPKIKRRSNPPVQKTEPASAKTDESSAGKPKDKQEVSTESQPKSPDVSCTGVRTRHNSKNSKQPSQKIPDVAANPTSVRSRDTTPDKSESQVNDAASLAVSLRSHDTRSSKNTESKASDNLQAIVRSRRRRTSSNSSTTPSKSFRGGNGTPSKPLPESKTNRAASTSREPTPTAGTASGSASKVPTLSTPVSQRGRERKTVPPASERRASQGILPSQPKKSNQTVTPSSAVSHVEKKPSDAAVSNTAQTDALKDTAQTPNSPAPNARQSASESRYLGAMVRRRQQPASWRSTNSSAAKKPRVLHSSIAPQYEIIRVEPVLGDSPSDQRRTRSNDRDAEPSPRTVHTRVSVDEVKPTAHSKETSKAGGDQKWSINRHFAPSGVKKISEQRFPFSFKRASRTRTQTK